MSESNFIDYVKIFCRSGNGGAGSAHLHRDRLNPKGGPDGGDGGRGGHVVIEATSRRWTLLHLKYERHILAGDGESGGASLRTGASGRDRVIEVPPGTVARDAETGEVLCEVTSDGERHVLFAGGRGGQGNDHFKNATHQTPRFAQPGEPGREGWVVLELKMLADVGLVGFPNAGKSTLLSVVSKARPAIADYPFTTLVPQLGIVPYRDGDSFAMADIPGIIEGAHEGRGLGLRFLRHIERNAVLLFMVPADAPDIREAWRVLLHEVEAYNPELLDKDRLLAVSKCDLLDAELQQALREELAGTPCVFFSSVTGQGIPELKDALWRLLNRN
ncbi:MAG: GTPase ObgE [Bacteroidales bacterium]|nr:GTPase ObgE [Bacteroidales bacterium]